MKEELLTNLIKMKDGMVTTKQAREVGISNIYLSNLVKKGKLERVRNGVYLEVDKFGDEYYLFQVRFPNAIFSHNTALYFNNLTERTPPMIDVTVYRGYNAHAFPKNIKVHYATKLNHNLGIEKIISPQGKEVLCYNLERTICDIIKNNASVDNETRSKSIKAYIKSKKMNERRLLEYAAQLKCLKKLEIILEVI
jgi:predicted transcriptional regulator of viral defense system